MNKILLLTLSVFLISCGESPEVLLSELGTETTSIDSIFSGEYEGRISYPVSGIKQDKNIRVEIKGDSISVEGFEDFEFSDFVVNKDADIRADYTFISGETFMDFTDYKKDGSKYFSGYFTCLDPEYNQISRCFVSGSMK